MLCENVLENWRLKWEAENLLVNFINDRFFDTNDEVRNRILRTILQIIFDGDSIEHILELIEQEKKKSKLENTEA